MIEKILFGIISFVFPVVFLYPQGLLYGTYLNYVYVLVCAVLLYSFRIEIVTGLSFGFYKRLLFLNLFANGVAYLFGNINIMQFISGNAPLLCAFCLNYIVLAFPEEKMNMMIKMLQVTIILVLFFIVIDGIWKPSWMYPLYYFKGTVEFENLFTFHHRAVGSLLSPAMAGFFCATIIGYSFVRLVYHKWSAYYTVLLSFSSLGLLLTASRTSMLALAIMFLFFFCFYGVRNKVGMICLSLMAVVTVSLLDLSFLDDIIHNLTYRNSQLAEGAFEGTGRSATIISALQNKFDARCLFWGIGTAEYSIVEDTSFSLAHNGLLSIFLPFGIAGLYLHYKLYRYYLIFRDKDYLNEIYLLFSSLWIVTLLGTFFSADMPISFFSICMQAILLALADRYIETN